MRTSTVIIKKRAKPVKRVYTRVKSHCTIVTKKGNTMLYILGYLLGVPLIVLIVLFLLAS